MRSTIYIGTKSKANHIEIKFTPITPMMTKSIKGFKPMPNGKSGVCKDLCTVIE